MSELKLWRALPMEYDNGHDPEEWMVAEVDGGGIAWGLCEDDAKWIVESRNLRTPAAQDAAQGREVGMLPEALIPHATEWYRLCERRFAVEKMTISGELAEAIVEAMSATPTTNSGEIGRKSVGDAQRLRELIGQYWDIAYQEGREGRRTDNEAGDASRVSLEIETVLRRLSRREG